jgi:hypothetical protein
VSSFKISKVKLTNLKNIKVLKMANVVLDKIYIHSCNLLNEIQLLGSSFSNLNILNCDSLSSFASKGFSEIELINCKSFTDNSLNFLTKIENNLLSLNIENCNLIKPNFNHLNLQNLLINNCSSVTDLFTELPNLKNLHIQGVDNLSIQFILKLNPISNLEKIENLILYVDSLTENAVEKLVSRIGDNLKCFDFISPKISSIQKKSLFKKFGF